MKTENEIWKVWAIKKTEISEFILKFLAFSKKTEVADFSVKTESEIEKFEQLKNRDFRIYFEIFSV